MNLKLEHKSQLFLRVQDGNNYNYPGMAVYYVERPGQEVSKAARNHTDAHDSLRNWHCHYAEELTRL